MNKKILLLLSIFITVFTTAQNKKITLEESVLQQNRLFRADRLAGFQWIPNTNKYTYYVENGTKLMLANAKDTKATEFLLLADLNKSLNTTLKSFFGYEWKNEKTLTISNGTKFYEFDVTNKTGKSKPNSVGISTAASQSTKTMPASRPAIVRVTFGVRVQNVVRTQRAIPIANTRESNNGGWR